MLKLTVNDVREVSEDLVQVQRLDEVMRDVEGVAVAEERVELVAVVAASEDDDEEVGGDVQHGEDSEPHCHRRCGLEHYMMEKVLPLLPTGWVTSDVPLYLPLLSLVD